MALPEKIDDRIGTREDRENLREAAKLLREVEDSLPERKNNASETASSFLPPVTVVGVVREKEKDDTITISAKTKDVTGQAKANEFEIKRNGSVIETARTTAPDAITWTRQADGNYQGKDKAGREFTADTIAIEGSGENTRLVIRKGNVTIRQAIDGSREKVAEGPNGALTRELSDSQGRVYRFIHNGKEFNINSNDKAVIGKNNNRIAGAKYTREDNDPTKVGTVTIERGVHKVEYKPDGTRVCQNTKTGHTEIAPGAERSRVYLNLNGGNETALRDVYRNIITADKDGKLKAPGRPDLDGKTGTVDRVTGDITVANFPEAGRSTVFHLDKGSTIFENDGNGKPEWPMHFKDRSGQEWNIKYDDPDNDTKITKITRGKGPDERTIYDSTTDTGGVQVVTAGGQRKIIVGEKDGSARTFNLSDGTETSTKNGVSWKAFPDGRIEYIHAGKVTSVTGVDGKHAWSLTYEDETKPFQATKVGDGRTEYEVGKNGVQDIKLHDGVIDVTRVNSDGSTTRISLKPDNRIDIAHPHGKKVLVQLDANGSPRDVVVNDRKYELEYDAAGKPVAIKKPDGSILKVGDLLGEVKPDSITATAEGKITAELNTGKPNIDRAFELDPATLSTSTTVTDRDTNTSTTTIDYPRSQVIIKTEVDDDNKLKSKSAELFDSAGNKIYTLNYGQEGKISQVVDQAKRTMTAGNGRTIELLGDKVLVNDRLPGGTERSLTLHSNGFAHMKVKSPAFEAEAVFKDMTAGQVLSYDLKKPASVRITSGIMPRRYEVRHSGKSEEFDHCTVDMQTGQVVLDRGAKKYTLNDKGNLTEIVSAPPAPPPAGRRPPERISPPGDRKHPDDRVPTVPGDRDLVIRGPEHFRPLPPNCPRQWNTSFPRHVMDNSGRLIETHYDYGRGISAGFVKLRVEGERELWQGLDSQGNSRQYYVRLQGINSDRAQLGVDKYGCIHYQSELPNGMGGYVPEPTPILVNGRWQFYTGTMVMLPNGRSIPEFQYRRYVPQPWDGAPGVMPPAL